MSRRSKVIGAGALLIVGVFSLSINALGGGELNAAGLQDTGFDITRILVWVGVIALVSSALLFISASAE